MTMSVEVVPIEVCKVEGALEQLLAPDAPFEPCRKLLYTLLDAMAARQADSIKESL